MIHIALVVYSEWFPTVLVIKGFYFLMTSLAILEGVEILDVFWGCRTIKKIGTRGTYQTNSGRTSVNAVVSNFYELIK